MPLKKLFQILLAIQFTLGIALAVLAAALFCSQNELSQSQVRQRNSYLLADELRQSSDDLTRLARTYVVTGNEEFERQYWSVLDIRNGRKPRPVDYNRIYWDFIAEPGQKVRTDGATISLHDLMVREGFTPTEFSKLSMAQKYSDKLVETEKIAMNAVKGLFDDGAGNFIIKKEPDREMAIRLMNDEAYHRSKVSIMRPIDDFYAMLEDRTIGDVLRLERRSMVLLQFLGGLIISILGMFIYSHIIIQRQIAEHDKAKQSLIEAAGTKAAAETEKIKAREVKMAYEELQKTQDLLVQAEKLSALGELSAGIAHELNNPLTGILGIARFYAGNKEIDDRLRDNFNDISQAGERMAVIIKGLTNYARPSLKELEELNCNDTIEALLNFTQKVMAGNQVDFQKSYEKDLPLIKGDKNQLQQVIANIIDNAFYAMHKKGVLRIFTRTVVEEGKKTVEMEFIDNGCGIKEEDLSRIFDPFFTTKRPGKGTGLGLAVAYSIINRHDGKILVESPPRNQETGTSFKVRIPAITDDDDSIA